MQDFNPEKRVKKMEEAILEEAKQKAQQIADEAEKQFKIDKNKILFQEKDRIAEDYKKKREQFTISERIKKSAKINETRLQKMNTRYDLVSRLKNEIFEEVKNTINDQNKYKAFLKDLIIQSMIKLMEEKVELVCLQKDVALIESIRKDCEKTFQDILKEQKLIPVPTVITIDKSHHLEDEDQKIIGGVILKCLDGKIQCINTVNSRIDMIFQEYLPEIRSGMFKDLK